MWSKVNTHPKSRGRSDELEYQPITARTLQRHVLRAGAIVIDARYRFELRLIMLRNALEFGIGRDAERDTGGFVGHARVSQRMPLPGELLQLDIVFKEPVAVRKGDATFHDGAIEGVVAYDGTDGLG